MKIACHRISQKNNKNFCVHKISFSYISIQENACKKCLHFITGCFVCLDANGKACPDSSNHTRNDVYESASDVFGLMPGCVYTLHYTATCVSGTRNETSPVATAVKDGCAGTPLPPLPLSFLSFLSDLNF